MVIRHEDLIGTYEQKRALVSQFNLMDDTFFSVVMRDKAACEYLLSALMGKTVSIIEHKTQYSIRNIESHSVVLDALVEDSEHNLYNVEVQKEDESNHERRMRYNQTAVDWTCKAVEDYASRRKEEGLIEGKIEGKIETIKNMLKDGLSLEKALMYTGIDEATYKEHSQRLQ